MADATGGPAFPTEVIEWDGELEHRWTEYGMSLRDWFAGQALSGLLAFGAGMESEGNNTANVILDEVAQGAYAVADAMLAAREATHG